MTVTISSLHYRQNSVAGSSSLPYMYRENLKMVTIFLLSVIWDNLVQVIISFFPIYHTCIPGNIGEMARNRLDKKCLVNLKFGDSHDQIEVMT